MHNRTIEIKALTAHVVVFLLALTCHFGVAIIIIFRTNDKQRHLFFVAREIPYTPVK